jgi:hypothetical protein
MAQLLEGIAKTVLAFTATSTRFLEAANNEAKDRVRYLQQIHANTEHVCGVCRLACRRREALTCSRAQGNWGETSRMSAADKMRRSDFQYGVLAKAGRDLDAHKATFIV